MAIKKSKNKKTRKAVETSRGQRSAQILFVIFAVILILSMLLSATANY